MQTGSGSFLPALSAEISSALICKTISSNMYGSLQMRQYQQQSVLTSSPEQLILKIYDLGIAACRRNDRSKVRAVLAELMGRDRKSTRLNSSHVAISYAVFC